MNKPNVSKSKEFKEKERKVRESLRLSVEREFVGDMIRLLDDELYCDVTFIVEDENFPAHVAILYARAPAFSQKFLPHLLMPSAVQSCIYIQNIKPEEFSVFLRSVYTENDVQDYAENEYPWTEKVSWYYPKNVNAAFQCEACNGFDDSLEQSHIGDQTDDLDLNKTVGEECAMLDNGSRALLEHKSEGNSQTSSTNVSNGNEKQNGKCEEVKENEFEMVICQSSEACAKTKETKKTVTGETNGEEANMIAMEACCKIGEDLINLVNDSKTSDVTFLVNNSERIKAHRSILCTRSSYFSAMLYGGWSEGEATEIPLFGIESSRAFLVVLYYLYGGITRIPLETADICELLRLADMYGLEGLKEVVFCQLKIDKCHLFHKPCSECIVGVIDCLDVSDLFQLSDLKTQSLRWIAKHFDKVFETKNFASLNKELQEETLALIQSTMNHSNVLDLLSRGEKLSSRIPRIKWAEPIFPLISALNDSCLSCIASHFPVIARRPAFLDMLKGVGWSTPLLEKIFTAVRKHLTIENCCEQLKEAMRLQQVLSSDASEEDGEKQFSEESHKLLEDLHSRCQEFIVSNLHRVSHTEGWRHLSPRTQTEVRKSKGGMFVDIGLPGQTKGTMSFTARKPPAASRTSNKNLSRSLKTTANNSRVRPPGSVDSVDNSRKNYLRATSSRAWSLAQRAARTSLGESSALASTSGSILRGARTNQQRPATASLSESSGLDSSSASGSTVPQGTRTNNSNKQRPSTVSLGESSGLGSSSASGSTVPQGTRTSKSNKQRPSTVSLGESSGLGSSSASGSTVRQGKRTSKSNQHRPSTASKGESSGLATSGSSRLSSQQDARKNKSNQQQNATALSGESIGIACTQQGATTSKSYPERTGNIKSGKRGSKEQPQDKARPLSLVTTSRNLPSASRTATSKNLSVRLKLRLEDTSTSRSTYASRAKEKMQNSSETTGHSTTRLGRITTGLSRSYTDVNHAKLGSTSGKKSFSDPSISERGRRKEDNRLNNDSKKLGPRGGKTSANTSRNSTSAGSNRTDVSRIKLARESVVGPVRMAQKSKSKSNTRDQEKKKQNMLGNVDNNKLKTEQTMKRPLATSSVESCQMSRIQNQTITLSKESEQDTSELTSLAVFFTEDENLSMNEKSVEGSPLQQDIVSSSSASPAHESKVSSKSSQDDDSMVTETEASSSSSSSALQARITSSVSPPSSPADESKVSSKSPQDDDTMVTETGA